MGTNEPNSPNKSSDSCVGKNNTSSKPNNGRYCHIVKRSDFDGYGFNLHSEKIKQGQYIGKVDANSPAEAAGLCEGDQIIEVNGVNIGTETHKQVVQRIKAISNEVRLLLIDTTSRDSDETAAKSADHTVDSKRSTMTNTNIKSHNISTAQVNYKAQPTKQVTDIATRDPTSPSEQNEYITSVSMLNMKSQSTLSNNSNNMAVDATDGEASTTNDNLKKLNGQTPESSILTASLTLETMEKPKTNQQQLDNDNNSQNNLKTPLNLNLTAAEMRAKLSAKKKFDPKNESVDLKKKFDIIQKL